MYGPAGTRDGCQFAVYSTPRDPEGHPIFDAATYVLYDRARMVVSDPADAAPLPAPLLGPHEAVTPLVRKPGSGQRPVLAIVQPFRLHERLVRDGDGTLVLAAEHQRPREAGGTNSVMVE